MKFTCNLSPYFFQEYVNEHNSKSKGVLLWLLLK